MPERMANVARHFKECDGIMKSELIKRFIKEMEDLLKMYRDLCKLEEGAELHRNQGKWIVLEKKVIPAFERIRDDLKKEAGSE